MDSKGLKTSIVVSIIVMCILLIYLVFYIFDINTNINNSDSKIIQNSTDTDILQLERFIDAFNNSCIQVKDLYTNKTLVSNIDSNIKLTTILNMGNNYNKKYIEDEYKKLFGEDVNINKTTGTCPKIVYNNNVSKVNCICSNKEKIVTKFIKSIKSDTEVKLYYKVAFYSSKRYLGKKLKIFSKNSDLTEIIDSRVLSNSVKELDYKKYLDDNYNNFYTYIYTFKLKDNNYYFYSINKEETDNK